jgi:RalA-binding protein 1
MSASSAQEADELQYLKSQNTQLWKVITKQKSVIHKLQRETARLLAERDELNQKLEARESPSKKEASSRSQTASPEPVAIHDSSIDLSSQHKETLTASPAVNDSPIPPPRSPYRQNSAKEEVRIELPSSKSTPTTPIMASHAEDRKIVPEPLILSQSPPSPVPDVLSPRKAIIDKDAQLFAEFNASLMKRERQKPIGSFLNATFPRDYQKEAEDARQEAMKRAITSSDDDSEISAMVTPTSTDETGGTVATEPTTPPAITSETALNSYSPPPESSKSSKLSLAATENRQLYPNDPNAMSDEAFASLSVKVVASKIKANEKNKEVLCFIISVGRIPQAQSDVKSHESIFEELWRVEKLYSDFINLDTKVSQY